MRKLKDLAEGPRRAQRSLPEWDNYESIFLADRLGDPLLKITACLHVFK